jgi:hypothetical protein
MPRNTSGTYTKPDGTTAVTGTPISSSAYNNLANDIGSALTDSLSRSGKGGMQADLSMGGKKITNLAAGTADADALRRDQVVSLIRQGVYGGISTGSANAQVLTMSPALPGYFPGMILTFIAGFANTDDVVTLNVNGLGADQIGKPGGGLDPGDITANGITVVVYSGVAGAWSLLNPKAPLDLGSAAFRGVGTDVSDLPEIVNGFGQFGAAVDAAHKALDNVAGAGVFRLNHASCTFTGSTGVILGSFNWGSIIRTGAGTYTISFANIGSTTYCVNAQVDFDSADASITDCFVQQATRTASSCVLVTRRAGTAFDFSRVSVNISRIA